MNLLDAAFLIGAVMACFGGWRLGLIRRVTGWIGLLVGVVVVSRFLPSILPTPDVPGPVDLLKRVGIIVIAGALGQTAGHLVGGRLRALVNVNPQLGMIDSVGGSIVGVLGLVIAAWMIIPTMVEIPGWPAQTARGSVVVARLTRALGRPPDVLAGIGDSLGVQGLGDALDNIKNLDIDPRAPDAPVLGDELVARVRPSVVKLSGPACNREQSGSGVVIAPGIVATNAHVVAGTESISITDDGGLDVGGTIRYLDLRNDIALVAAPDLDRPALELVDAAEGDIGAVMGYPGGGPLVVEPYNVAAVTTATARDIYDQGRFTRNILILGSRIEPGDSGGPLITTDGRVAGIAFGIAPDRVETAYAIPADLLRGLVARVSADPLPSGACRL